MRDNNDLTFSMYVLHVLYYIVCPATVAPAIVFRDQWINPSDILSLLLLTSPDIVRNYSWCMQNSFPLKII